MRLGCQNKRAIAAQYPELKGNPSREARRRAAAKRLTAALEESLETLSSFRKTARSTTRIQEASNDNVEGLEDVDEVEEAGSESDDDDDESEEKEAERSEH